MLTIIYPAIPAREERAAPSRRASGEGHGAMYITLALSLISVIGAAVVAEFDPSKWAQFIILIVLSASGVISVVIAALIKTIRELRKLRAEIKQVPAEVKTHVTEAIEESPIPTTPAQIRASDERVAAVIKQAVVETKSDHHP